MDSLQGGSSAFPLLHHSVTKGAHQPPPVLQRSSRAVDMIQQDFSCETGGGKERAVSSFVFLEHTGFGVKRKSS